MEAAKEGGARDPNVRSVRDRSERLDEHANGTRGGTGGPVARAKTSASTRPEDRPAVPSQAPGSSSSTAPAAAIWDGNARRAVSEKRPWPSFSQTATVSRDIGALTTRSRSLS